MATVKSFEDLEAWQLARALVVEKIYDATATGPFGKDFGLRNQIRRAAVSIASNIGEGFERDGEREFIQFLSQAKGSCGEVRTQLRIARDLGYLTEDTFRRLREGATRTGETIFGLVRYLKHSSFRGKKFNEEPQEVP